jgi:FAD/FMN-containing dehydrogenase
MDENLLAELRKSFRGDIANDEQTLSTYSHDASLFEVKPQVVVFPRDEADVGVLVKFVNAHRADEPSLSLTGRSAGTDMSGGSINDSVIVAFERYFNHPPVIAGTAATVQPGMFYRDFEKAVAAQNLLFPSYPASREICALGGLVNNNSGGEKSLRYGKTERYVKRVRYVLRDGNAYDFYPLTEGERLEKMKLPTLEGDIYRQLSALIAEHEEVIRKAKPAVSKNSAGYALWNVWNREAGTFDLTKLFVGAQGTLGLLVEADIALVPPTAHRGMIVIFLYDLLHLAEIINVILPLEPESFESYDNNTLKLALKYFREFAAQLGTRGFIRTALRFLPEFFMVLTGGVPKFILQVDFTGDDLQKIQQKLVSIREKVKPYASNTRMVLEDREQKYWLIRRESFNLLRNKIHDKHTAPFIDDFVVLPKYLPEFLPRLDAIMKGYPSLVFTLAGHVGDGNFHIIPLMDITKQSERNIIPKLSEEVYNLVLQYGGSITGEHNDGLIRTPYLEKMFGSEVTGLFAEVKRIFDPDRIFNPRKKVGGSLDFAMSHIRQNW